MYYLYTNELEKEIFFTLKECGQKITIINLKAIRLEDFGDQGAEIEDIPDYIKENLEEYGEQILIDMETGKLRDNWLFTLHDFIENNI